MEVEDWKNGASLDPGALLLIGHMDDLRKVRHWHDLLGVDVVPLLGGWKVDLDLGNSTKERHGWVLVANLGCYEDVLTEHELSVELESHLVLGELHPHGTNDGESIGVSFKEEVVEVVDHGVSGVDGSQRNSLDSWGLQPWLSHCR